MGGVDLWQNDSEHDDSFSFQSMQDKTLEIVCVHGAWHLGKLQVWASLKNISLIVYLFSKYLYMHKLIWYETIAPILNNGIGLNY